VEEGALRVDVADAGRGIPAAHRPSIFQPFFTTKATGTGLGLAVVKRIVQAHRGEVSLETAEGKGTTFTLRLPLPTSPADQSAPTG
jgi:two-component system, NtrC family, sensor histidine kinase HydH